MGRGTTSRTRVCIANRRVNDEERAGERDRGRGMKGEGGGPRIYLYFNGGWGSINLLKARNNWRRCKPMNRSDSDVKLSRPEHIFLTKHLSLPPQVFILRILYARVSVH